MAIEVLRRLRARGVDTTLTVCGDGPNRTVLEQQARDEGLWNAVSFEGWTSPEELAEHYRKAEALLVPSRYEPFGIVALEAIASRCPVVASNVDGLPEAVGDCGILVEPDAPEALADGIQRVLDPSVREQLRAAMPEHVDRHRMDRIADEYLDIIRTVAHEA
ncbi:glycosyltransferase involved in cell wall biosynthesis [Salinibacter ruber]|nr:glycosyltransferase involved in cell wall biosynthesis [Salinibacter ruber]